MVLETNGVIVIIIYADNAATTPVREEVKEKIKETLNIYANPSSSYSIAYDSANLIDEARENVAKLIGANKDEVYFTSGGSEGDNWVIKGIGLRSLLQVDNWEIKGVGLRNLLQGRGGHIITSAIEHPAIKNSCKQLEQYCNTEISYIGVDNNGIVSPMEVLNKIQDNTFLISVMYANNETGAIQLIPEISKIAKDNKILFHTDAVQAVGHCKINVHNEHIDMLTLSGHKFGAPKGIGAVYIRKGINIPPLICGGKQENHKRGGTENLLGIVGIGEAARLALQELEANSEKVSNIRYILESELQKNLDDFIINCERTKRLSGHLSLSIKDVNSDALVLMLSQRGIMVSSGSACSSGEQVISPTLQAIGVPKDYIRGSIRISLSELNTEEDARFISINIIECVNALRRIRRG